MYFYAFLISLPVLDQNDSLGNYNLHSSFLSTAYMPSELLHETFIILLQ